MMNSSTNNKELSRLISAAVIDKEFCSLLLTDPAGALVRGYNGEIFNFSTIERQVIIKSQADSLVNFVKRVIE